VTINCPKFTNNATYKVIIDNFAFHDAAGNPFAGTTVSPWTFKALADTTPPSIAAYSPAVSATSVAVDPGSFSLTFNEPVTVDTSKTALIFPTNNNNASTQKTLTLSLDPSNNKRVLLTLPSGTKLTGNTQYSITLPSGAIQDLAGNPFPGITSTYQWTFTTVNNTSTPTLSSAAMDGSVIVLTYSETLDSTKVPNPTNFYVTVNNAYVAVTGVTISGKEVRLTLASGVLIGQTVKVSYSPDASPAKRIQNLAGNAAAAFTGRDVTNTADTTLPKPVSGIFSGSTVTITFNRALASMANDGRTQFTVKLNGSSVGVSSAYTSGSSLVLNLGYTTTYPQSVSVSYAPGSYPLRDTSGNWVSAFDDFYVRNIYDTEPPELVSGTAAGNKVTLNFDEGLDASSVPAAANFSVRVDGGAMQTVSSVAVNGTSVELTLSQTLQNGQTILVYYFPGSPGILDLAGNAAAAISAYGIVVDSNAASLVSSAVAQDDKLTINYSKSLLSTSVPNVSQYTVKADSSYITVKSVSVSGSQVVLTLYTPVKAGQQIKVSYSSTGTPLKDSSGSAVPAFTDYAVTNLESSSAGAPSEYLEADGTGGYGLNSKAVTTSSGTTPSGKPAKRLIVDGDKLVSAFVSLKSSGASQPQISLKVPSTEAGALVSVPLRGLMSASTAVSNGSFRVIYGDLQYILPLKAINYNQVANSAASNATVEIRIEKTASSALSSAISGRAQMLAAPADFSVVLLSGGQQTAIDSFDQYVERSFDLLTSVPASDVAVVRFDADAGELTYVPTTVVGNGSGMTVRFKRKGNSTYAVVRRTSFAYGDMTKHWARDDVNLLAAKFIVDGPTPTTFAPGKNVTRADFAKYIARGLGLTGNRSAANKFVDVGSGSKNAAYIGAASEAGIVLGDANGKFRPDAYITREEMATMMQRALAYAGVQPTASSASLTRFKDAGRISSYAKDAVSVCVDVGIIKGITDTTFVPKDNATRAQAAIMIRRLLEYAGLLQS